MTVIVRQGSRLRRKLKCLLFDLDDTLYRSEGMAPQVLKGIQKYMVAHLGYSAETSASKATELYLAHGTTLAGLVATGASIDFEQWHKEVHYGHVEYEKHIHADPALRKLLCGINLPKFVFTNADSRHAEICLRLLGIDDCFQGVFHFESLAEAAAAAGMVDPEAPRVVCKPSPQAYSLVLKALGMQAEEVLFFDDSSRNIRAAHALGIMTVMVGTDQVVPGADLTMLDLHHIPAMMPELLGHPGSLAMDAVACHDHEALVQVAA